MKDTQKYDSYGAFAEVYDLFMDNIPYQDWCEYLCSLLKEYGVTGGILLDLGCGTGSLTELMAARGFDMIGIDNSEEMLQIAMEKRLESGFDVLYLLQDMREFELYGTVSAVVCICDSMNYLLELHDFTKVCKLVNNYLDPKGIFIFDLNTEYKYEQILGDTTIAEKREEGSFIWENFYDKEAKINEYDLTLFIQEEEDLYRKYEETHLQKAYSLDQVKDALKQGGLEFVTAYDAFTRNPPNAKSERIYIVARECQK